MNTKCKRTENLHNVVGVNLNELMACMFVRDLFCLGKRMLNLHEISYIH